LQRQREFGIRIALGATRGTIRRMVLGQGLAMLACGVTAGVLLSLFTSRIASALLLNLRGPASGRSRRARECPSRGVTATLVSAP
jgi:ABC-type antimicrobial peptide transport system permease subunit